MKSAALAFLLVGFGVGFGAMYKWTSKRAPEIARPLPQWVSPQAQAAPPPVDPRMVLQLEDTIRKDPQNFNALRDLGNLKYDQQDFNAAAALYQKALELRPGDVNLRTDRGGALFRANRVDESLAELRKSLELNPTNPQTLFSLGIALMQAKDDREGALALWHKLVETNPDFPDVDTVKELIREVESKKP